MIHVTRSSGLIPCKYYPQLTASVGIYEGCASVRDVPPLAFLSLFSFRRSIISYPSVCSPNPLPWPNVSAAAVVILTASGTFRHRGAILEFIPAVSNSMPCN